MKFNKEINFLKEITKKKLYLKPKTKDPILKTVVNFIFIKFKLSNLLYKNNLCITTYKLNVLGLILVKLQNHFFVLLFDFFCKNYISKFR